LEEGIEMKYTARQIKAWDVLRGSNKSDVYYPARSLNHTVEPLMSRIKNAWGVLTGKYDALDWEELK
jgi:hypothetical protein